MMIRKAFGVRERVAAWVAACVGVSCWRGGAATQWVVGATLVVFAALQGASQSEAAITACTVGSGCAGLTVVAARVRSCAGIGECACGALCDLAIAAAAAIVGATRATGSSRDSALLERAVACGVGLPGAAVLGGRSPEGLALAAGAACVLFEGDRPLWRRESIFLAEAAERKKDDASRKNPPAVRRHVERSRRHEDMMFVEWFARFDADKMPVVGPRAAAVLRGGATLASAAAALAAGRSAARVIALAATPSFLRRVVASRELPWWCGDRWRELEPCLHVATALALAATERAIFPDPEKIATATSLACGASVGLAAYRLYGCPLDHPVLLASCCASGLFFDGPARSAAAALIAAVFAVARTPTNRREPLLAAATAARLARISVARSGDPQLLVGAAGLACAAFLSASPAPLAAGINWAAFAARDRARVVFVATAARLAVLLPADDNRLGIGLACVSVGDAIAASTLGPGLLACDLCCLALAAPAMTRRPCSESLLASHAAPEDPPRRAAMLAAALSLGGATGLLGPSAPAVALWGAANVALSPRWACVVAFGALSAIAGPPAACACCAAAALWCEATWAAAALAVVAAGTAGGLDVAAGAFPASACAAAIRDDSSDDRIPALATAAGLVLGLLRKDATPAAAAALTLAALDLRRDESYGENDEDSLRTRTERRARRERRLAATADAACVGAAVLVAAHAARTSRLLAACAGPVPLVLLPSSRAKPPANLSTAATTLRPDALRRLAPLVSAAVAIGAEALSRNPPPIALLSLVLSLPAIAATCVRLATRPRAEPNLFVLLETTTFALAAWPLSLAPPILAHDRAAKLFGALAAIASGAFILADLEADLT